MSKMRFFIQFLLLLLVFPVGAAEMQSLQSIRDTAKGFVEASLQGSDADTVVTVGKLDRRLRLRHCSKPLQAYLPSQAALHGNTTIGVRCEGEKPWSLMVQARIQKYQQVAVASHSLGRGQELKSGDYELKRVDVTNLSAGTFYSQEALQEMVMRRSVRAGTILTTSMVKPAILIKRGEKVIIRAETGAIHVRMEGLAMENGAKGELIEVKNLSSKQVIEAIVVSPGLVQVRM